MIVTSKEPALKVYVNVTKATKAQIVLSYRFYWITNFQYNDLISLGIRIKIIRNSLRNRIGFLKLQNPIKLPSWEFHIFNELASLIKSSKCKHSSLRPTKC